MAPRAWLIDYRIFGLLKKVRKIIDTTCLGHCEAARRGDGGKDASELIGEGRELFDEKIKGDSRKDCNADRAANNQGRSSNPNIPCKQVCGSLRPNGLNPRY